MKILNKLRTVLCLLCVCLGFYACTDSLDEHVAITDSKLTNSLTEKIAQNADLSEFSALLEETGYDEILNQSKSYTVWVPDNEAMSQVPSEVLNDPIQLKRFVANHIALSAFTTDMVRDTLSIQMLTEKYVDFLPGFTIDGVNIEAADQYAGNGVYHVIGGNLAPQNNVWEYIVENPENYTQNDFVESLSYFDLFNVEQNMDEIEPENARDTLDNEMLRVFELENEQKNFTYFVMTDDGFRQEKLKMMPLSKRGSQDSTQVLAQYNVVKDLVFEGIYTPENMPDTLTSIHGVKVPVDLENIIGDPVQLSNGIVYRFGRVDVALEDKLVPVKIEGETPWGFSHNRNNNVFYRERTDPTGEYFEDIVVRNHGVRNFAVHYKASRLYSTTYKVYFRAVNDFEGEFKQRVRIGGRYVEQEDGTIELVDVINENPSVWIYPNVYEEIYAGEFTLEQAGDIDMISLMAENTSSNRWNPLSLDYMVLVPVIE